MSEKLCALRKIGGGMSETVLWTNPSPTSVLADSTKMNLSESMENFNFLKATARARTTNADTISVIMSVEDFKKTSSTNPVLMRFPIYANGYIRLLRYDNNTKINISRAFIAGGGDEDNANVIITQLVGLK